MTSIAAASPTATNKPAIALGNRPSSDQLLLLHAALDEPGAGGSAWRRWRSAVDLADVDPGSARLLPLVYRNLDSRCFDAQDAGHLKELYRRIWSHNQVLFRRGAEAIGALAAADIEALAIKGASLALLAYGDVGARPMEDVDLLVPFDRAGDAIEALEAAGWSPERDDDLLAWTEAHHSLGFAGPDGGHVDLHWFALWQPASDAALWRASAPFDLAGVPTRAPCAADQLLLTCVHGIPWSRLPSFRWIADATILVRSASESFDWDHLASEAERRRLTVACAAALAYLREEFGVAVPEATQERLRRAPSRRHERVAFRAACQPDSPLRTLRMAWDRYRRLRDLDTGAPRPASFVSFARSFWGLDSVWRLPLHVGRALTQVLPQR
jgi:hypothetical protein